MAKNIFFNILIFFNNSIKKIYISGISGVKTIEIYQGFQNARHLEIGGGSFVAKLLPDSLKFPNTTLHNGSMLNQDGLCKF